MTLATIDFAFVQSSISPLLPTVQARFAASPGQVTWLITIYLVSAAITTPLLARVADAFGRRLVLLLVVAVFALGCAAAALASSLWMLLVARAIQGSAGVMFPLSVAILRDVMAPERVQGAVGRLSGLLAIGSAGAVVVVGPMTSQWGYSSVFWFPAGLSLLVFGLALWCIPESPERTPGLPSRLSLLLFAAWITLLMLGVSEVPSGAWKPSTSLLAAVACGVLLRTWWNLERTTSHPLISKELNAWPHARWASVAAFTLGATIFGNLALVPQFLQASGDGLGLSLTEAGLCLLPQALGFTAGGVFAGALTRRFSAPLALLMGGVCSALAYAWLAAAAGGLPNLVVFTTISGFGNGLAGAVLPAIVIMAAPAPQASAAAGLNANVRLVGGAVGAQAVAAVGLRSASPSMGAVATAFVMLAVLSGLSALMGWRLVPDVTSTEDRILQD